jgi:hypothetical protein
MDHVEGPAERTRVTIWILRGAVNGHRDGDGDGEGQGEGEGEGGTMSAQLTTPSVH